MKSVRVRTASVECVQGDIANQPDIEAIVNSANAELMTGAGVAGAIHRAAGPGLYEECRSHAPIWPGDAIITGGHKLPNRYVIHCLGPVFGVDVSSDKLLASCYRNALQVADHHQIRSIAFPAISTGVFGYPMEAAARIAIRTILTELPRFPKIQRVRFVLFGGAACDLYEQILRESRV